ncbi:MAG: hypothetical protein D6679_06205 [Candidatus Hydrogenedentota bacterium]|nr:MAG: hypothetical protein D6679_06205 [Candidatus Hydrogenedentota bacterium]
MPLFSAVPAAVWLVAETLIVFLLAWFESRLTGGSVRGTYASTTFLFFLGFFQILRGPALYSFLWGSPFGPRLAWNLICLVWVLLELSMFRGILRVTYAARTRFLSHTTPPPPDHLFLTTGFLFALFTVAFEYAVGATPRRPEIVILLSYSFVRVAGFAWLLIESAIAYALFKASKTATELLCRIPA